MDFPSIGGAGEEDAQREREMEGGQIPFLLSKLLSPNRLSFLSSFSLGGRREEDSFLASLKFSAQGQSPVFFYGKSLAL